MMKNGTFLIIISHQPQCISCPSTTNYSDWTDNYVKTTEKAAKGSPQWTGEVTKLTKTWSLSGFPRPTCEWPPCLEWPIGVLSLGYNWARAQPSWRSPGELWYQKASTPTHDLTTWIWPKGRAMSQFLLSKNCRIFILKKTLWQI